MRIFVTGASGFIGSKFCRQATSKGHDILALQTPHRLNNLPYEVIKSFSPDAAVHCAWIATPGVYLSSPENLSLQKQSKEMFEWLSGIGVKQIIGCGTCAEYASSTSLLEEDKSPLQPASLYARSKHQLHQDLKKIANQSSVVFSWARIFYPYGPDEHPDRLISSLFRAFNNDKRYEIKTPQAIRDYIHIDDVASALLFLVEKRAGGSFNIGTGKGTCLWQLEAMIADMCSKASLLQKNLQKFCDYQNDRVVASITKINSIGWEPRLDLFSGLQTYKLQNNRSL